MYYLQSLWRCLALRVGSGLKIVSHGKGIGWINMVKFLWVWLGQNQPLRCLRCFAFVTFKVFPWSPRAEILALLGRESLVSLDA